jgi:phage/plasmid-associated DNA primase
MQATQASRAELDYVGQWLEECAKITRNPDDFTPNAPLYGSYETWCQDNGVTPKHKRGLTMALTGKGIDGGARRFYAGRVQRGCSGIRLLTDMTHDAS